MPEARLPLKQIVMLYLLALIVVVASAIAHPESWLLMSLLLGVVSLFFALAFAVLLVTALYIVSLITGRMGLGTFQYVLVRVLCWQINQQSHASDPARILLDRARLRRLCPEYFKVGLNPFAWIDAWLGRRAANIFLVRDQLAHGDSRAAVVVSVSPLLVATYTDELDCVALLRFPDEFAREYDLRRFSRLLTINSYIMGDPAPDLEIGPLSLNQYGNFQPFIAEFLSDDPERIRERKSKISEEEWRRAITLGRRCLEQHGGRARNGRPSLCIMPAVS